MTFLGLLNWIVAFFVRAACGLLLTALVPVLLVGLAFHWFDVGGADWAAKWIVTVFGPFFVAFILYIFWKVWHLARTGRHIGMWATLPRVLRHLWAGVSVAEQRELYSLR